VLGGTTDELPELAADASPVSHVHGAAPPFLLVHGESDTDVPLAQSRRMHDALAAAGAPVTLQVVPGRPHMLTGIPDSDLESLLDQTTAFLLGAAENR
jgi:dipeptidyl aminopeptidase/acylaminoacyl peptidase